MTEQLADANFVDQVRAAESHASRIEERRRCALVVLAHRTEIDVGTSYFRIMTWLDEGTAEDADFAEVNQPPAAGDGSGWDVEEEPDPDRAAAMQLTGGLIDELTELVAGIRRLREENERLRAELASRREHAELTVVRAGDFLRTALSIIAAGEEQYSSPEIATPGDRTAGNSG
jgi:hypothetical protein